MKRLSIHLKITLWFSAALIVVVALTYAVILSVGNRVIQKTIKDNLIGTVENNLDEIEYKTARYNSLEEENADHYITYKDGFLEIDDDYLDEVNQVYTSLYDGGHTLLYGENPIAKETQGIPIKDRVLQTLKIGGIIYYVFDRELTAEGLDGLWVRGIVSESQGREEMSSIANLSLIIMPFLVLLAIVGGYFIAKRTLSPLKQIAETTDHISRGNDLQRRIDIGLGENELHMLANSFNQMFERLDQAFEQERQFTSDVSHELRTPTSVIMAQCEYSLERERSVEDYEKALRVIGRQGKKMSRLIGDMLEFRRLEMNLQTFPKEVLDLSGLLTSSCYDMGILQEQGITLSYSIEPNLFVFGNWGLLNRMVENLISNGYRYGKEEGHLWVSLKTVNEEVALAVQDDGIGMEQKEIQKIFQRFYRVDTSRSGPGTGLGLAMVWQIVELHRGRIEVESVPGKGSTFTIYLKSGK